MSIEPSPSRSEHVVLGLIARYGAMTPYELNTRVADTVGFFWPIPRAQLYRDTTRLTELGLLDERVEQAGRRRRIFDITIAGRQALSTWLAGDHNSPTQIRDPALLKLAFSDLASTADLYALAAAQADTHQQWKELYMERLNRLPSNDQETLSRRRVLQLGCAIEAAYERFWAELADRGDAP